MSKIDVINYALTIMDAQMIDTLEESESARIIAAEYSRAARHALEQLSWNFATVRQSLANIAEGETLETVTQHRHNKPSDWLRTVGVYGDKDCTIPVFYDEEKGEIVSKCPVLWMKYISRDYIDRTGDWSQSFSDYVSYLLASRVRSRYNLSRQKVQEIAELTKRARQDAIAFDVKANTNQPRERGKYVQARRGGSYSNRTGEY